ncbi:MAG: glycosyltransferase family 2 protein [Candidatus Omnitrophota bacterium]
MENLKFSVCVPTYNMGDLLGQTIKNVLSQTYSNFEIVISDNNSSDNTQEIVRSFKDERIKYFKNEENLGYYKNLCLSFERAAGDIIYLLSGKSLISKDALEKTCNAFNLSDDIGAVTRPYYWYGKDVNTVVRKKDKVAIDEDLVVSIDDDPELIIKVVHLLDNPAGLAFRKKYMNRSFNQDAFVEFTYPFIAIWKEHKIVVLKDYTMACPAFSYSGSQNPKVYEKSPMQCWIDLFETVFKEEKFKNLREICIRDFVAVNYIGLVQVRNYARKYSFLIREIVMLLKYRWQNIFNFRFWFFSLGTMIMPRFILKKIVAIYKAKINSRIIKTQGDNICLKQ